MLLQLSTDIYCLSVVILIIIVFMSQVCDRVSVTNRKHEVDKETERKSNL